jgi:hypothetical protein
MAKKSSVMSVRICGLAIGEVYNVPVANRSSSRSSVLINLSSPKVTELLLTMLDICLALAY